MKPLVAAVLPKHAITDHTISRVYTTAVSPRGIAKARSPYETALNRQVDQARIANVKTADIVPPIHNAIFRAVEPLNRDGFVDGDASSEHVGVVGQIDGVTFRRGVHRGLDVGGGLSPVREWRCMITIWTHIKVGRLGDGGICPDQ